MTQSTFHGRARMSCARTRTTRRLHRGCPWLLAGLLILAGCSSGVNLTLNVITPCDNPTLMQTLGCQLMSIVVYSLDATDPLAPGGDPGPQSR